jgi:hypothetical protein
MWRTFKVDTYADGLFNGALPKAEIILALNVMRVM